MARTSLPPGFRFHPTDVELVMYYLKRKVMGKKFQLEAIAEVNINKYSPWDLPDKSCVRSRDLEWFFFCPREKKYASGARVKRATENGYWKTTGKDRPIHHNDKLVGTVKTLIFHLGHAPKGERTDWVLHEYRILDNKLSASGVQDTYVLCKVFKKNGPGPKNGAQYGAPFNEADWTDDDTDAQTDAISLASDGPSTTTLLQTEEQSCPVNVLSNPGNKPGLSLIEDQSTPSAHPTSEVFMHNSNTEDEMDRLLAQFTDEGAIPFNENGVNQVTSSDHPTSEVFMHETEDEMDRLLAQFTDEDMIPFNGDGVNQDNLGGKEKNPLPSSDAYDIYNGLCDLHSWSRGNVESLESWKVHSDQYKLENNLSLENSAYIELNDLLPLLDGPIGFTENSQPSTSDPFRTFTHENLQPSTSEPFRTFTQENIQHLNSGSYSDGIGQFTAYSNQLHVLPQTVSTSLYQERQEAAYDLNSVLGQLDNGVDFARGIERGSCAD